VADLSKLANQLGNLTVLEAAELAKKLQARWDVQLKRRPGLTFNEGKVCDAIVRHLEEREQHGRAGLRWPEQENHKSPVEVVFTYSNRRTIKMDHEPTPMRADIVVDVRSLLLVTFIQESSRRELSHELSPPDNSYAGRRSFLTPLVNGLPG
jgi:Ribosomal protein L7/L12 dimerisation domain